MPGDLADLITTYTNLHLSVYQIAPIVTTDTF